MRASPVSVTPLGAVVHSQRTRGTIPKCSAAPGGKSTLNRRELSHPDATRKHRISHNPPAIEALFVDAFLDCYSPEIEADLEAHDLDQPAATFVMLAPLS